MTNQFAKYQYYLFDPKEEYPEGSLIMHLERLKDTPSLKPKCVGLSSTTDLFYAMSIAKQYGFFVVTNQDWRVLWYPE